MMGAYGILLPISSLPNRHGCGDFSLNVRNFLMLLQKNHVTYWQILPLNPMGLGDSPYQSYSSFAIDPIYISLDELTKQGYLPKIKNNHAFDLFVDFQNVRKFKEVYYRMAFQRFVKDDDFIAFTQKEWVKEYACYQMYLEQNQGKHWNEWTIFKDDPEQFEYHCFLQYIVFQQFKAFQQLVHQYGIQLIGDIPFYVGYDSSDVYFYQKQFLLDEYHQPLWIAGVPPDYFSKTGQRWGNPIYDWEAMKKDGYAFWLKRLEHMHRLYDLVRIDHFRAFDTYWMIDAKGKDAIQGHWEFGPSYDFFDTLFQMDPNYPLIAEDLGLLRQEVYTLRDHYGLSGMYILQFSLFEQTSHVNQIVYTGTHDNPTLKQWYLNLSNKDKKRVRKLVLSHRGQNVFEALLHYTCQCESKICIIPMADVLQSKHGRINTPGTIGKHNWSYRMVNDKGLAYALQSCFGKKELR